MANLWQVYHSLAPSVWQTCHSFRPHFLHGFGTIYHRFGTICHRFATDLPRICQSAPQISHNLPLICHTALTIIPVRIRAAIIGLILYTTGNKFNRCFSIVHSCLYTGPTQSAASMRFHCANDHHKTCNSSIHTSSQPHTSTVSNECVSGAGSRR